MGARGAPRLPAGVCGRTGGRHASEACRSATAYGRQAAAEPRRARARPDPCPKYARPPQRSRRRPSAPRDSLHPTNAPADAPACEHHGAGVSARSGGASLVARASTRARAFRATCAAHLPWPTPPRQTHSTPWQCLIQCAQAGQQGGTGPRLALRDGGPGDMAGGTRLAVHWRTACLRARAARRWKWQLPTRRGRG